MSVHALSWVFRHSEATLGARLVLLVLADHAKDDGTFAWPSVETMAAQARLSKRAVQAALRRLEADGHIRSRGQSKAGTTIYDVLMGGAESAPGVKIATPEMSSASPDPSIEPSEESSPEGEDIRAIFDHWRQAFGLNGRSRLTPERRRKIRARLRQGYSADRLKRAVEGCAGSKWHVEQGHTDLAWILHNGSRVERFEALPSASERTDFSMYDRPRNA